MKGRSLVYVLLIATTIVWGGSFVAIKQALRYLSPLDLLFMRLVPAALVFSLLLCGRERTILSGMLRRDWQSLVLMGLFGVVIYQLALTTGEQVIPAGTASLIMAVNPAFVLMMSALLRQEKVTAMRVLGLSLASVGLFIVIRFASGGRIDLSYVRSVRITLVAPLSWAAYPIISRPLANKYPPLAVTGLGTILGALPVLAVLRPALVQRVWLMPRDVWASVAYLVLLATVGGVTVWVLALQKLEASRVGVFIYLVPLWGSPLSNMILREPLTLPFFLGAAVVIGGVILVNRA